MNETVLESAWNQFVARVKANLFVMSHWNCRIYEEIEWIRRPGHEYSEHTRFIGVINSDYQIVRSYYGEARLSQEVL